jgi:hypothetical protein
MQTNLGPPLALGILQDSDPNWPNMTDLIVPHLIFAERKVDLSECQFLKRLDIQFCHIHPYLSKNKGLVELILPGSLETLHIYADQPLKFIFLQGPGFPFNIVETSIPTDNAIEFNGKHLTYEEWTSRISDSE